MPPKTTSEKNLWQRLPVRWRVIFMIAALIGASYAVRHAFPMTPSLRDGQTFADVKALSVETVFETPDAAEKAISPQNRGKIPHFCSGNNRYPFADTGGILSGEKYFFPLLLPGGGLLPFEMLTSI